jgi:membrane-bound ClpP family serine protease
VRRSKQILLVIGFAVSAGTQRLRRRLRSATRITGLGSGDRVAPGPGSPSPDLAVLVTATRVPRMGRLLLILATPTALAGLAFAAGLLVAHVAVLWVTGAVILVLLTATGFLAANAGGHAWFLSLPVLVLAIAWGFTASSRSSAAGWSLVALTATASAAAMTVAGVALRQRLHRELTLLPPLRGCTGVAVTELTPVGVVQLGGETWSAESVSGMLPAGAPIHALKARGIRLQVWSEVGTVPDGTLFDIKEVQK